VTRVFGFAAVAVVVVALVVLGVGSGGGGGGKSYFVELDNAFGLIEGADVKVAGVRAGKVTSMALDRSDMRAKIGIRVDRAGFGDLRADTFCETRPQSLIGEYFLDCKPGKAKQRLPEGGTVPVKQTGSTIPVDLVNDIMRRPYRERFSILLSELGAGLAARGPDLNETIRRASPALREVDRVLAQLAQQRRVIRDLYRDADHVVGRLATNRKDVTRFVGEARDTAATVATRRQELRRQYQTFPTFLRELRPTMKLLGDAAERQAPALRRLRENAGYAERLFKTLGPFAEVSRPAFRTLGQAAHTGRGAVRDALPRIPELRAFAKPLPEAATNLAMVLEHLDDPKFAVEKDTRSGRANGGFTGLEAVLRYIWAQSQAINLFDGNSYFLKVSAFLDRQCAAYANATTVKAEGNEKCLAWLGPNQPGITTPDPTKTAAPAQARSKQTRAHTRTRHERSQPAASAPSSAAPAPAATPDKPAPKPPVQLPKLPDLPPLPQVGPPDVKQSEALLDYLLGT
jgi:virulence factor Mce-like protein